MSLSALTGFIGAKSVIAKESRSRKRDASADLGPVGLVGVELTYSMGEDLAFGGGEVGVGGEVGLGVVAGKLYDLAIVGEVGDVEVEGDAALLGSFDVAGAAQLHVFLGNDETVVGLGHDLESVPGVVAELELGHEYAEALVGTSAHAASELVKLRESESLGVFDDHDGGVGHVHAHLDHGGGHEDVRLSAGEELHLVVFGGGFESAMDEGHAIVGEGFAHFFVTLLEGEEVEFLVFLDEGVDDIGLSSLAQLLPHEVVHGLAVALVAHEGGDGFASRGEFVDDAHVEVAIDGHGQCAWDGCGGHHQHMGRHHVFAPQLGTLRHAEAVLLVDDGKAEVVELDGVLDERVRADEDVQLARGEPLVDAVAVAFACGAGEQLHGDADACRQGTDGVEML